MPSTAGRKARIKIASDSSGSPGTFNAVTGIKSVQQSIDGQTIDDSEFGIEWVQNIVGIPGGKLSMNGGRRASDTNGQNKILDALISGDFIWYQWLYDGTNGLQQQCSCVKFETSAEVNDRVTVSIELAGNGAVTEVP